MKSVLLLTVLALMAASPAVASVGTDVERGRALASRSCSELDNAGLRQVGEYAMERMVGSRAAHEAMDARMTAVLGAAAGQRMHEQLGRRVVGCPGAPGMMGTGWGMMRTGDLAWMRGDAWRAMSRGDWIRMQERWLGDGGPAAGTLLAVSGALVLALGAIVLLARRARHMTAS